MPILTKRTAFKIFVVADAVALALSMAAVCVYFFVALKNRKRYSMTCRIGDLGGVCFLT